MKYYTTILDSMSESVKKNGLKFDNGIWGEVYSTIKLARFCSHPADEVLLELELEDDEAVSTPVEGVFFVEKDIPPSKIKIHRLRDFD